MASLFNPLPRVGGANIRKSSQGEWQLTLLGRNGKLWIMARREKESQMTLVAKLFAEFSGAPVTKLGLDFVVIRNGVAVKVSPRKVVKPSPVARLGVEGSRALAE